MKFKYDGDDRDDECVAFIDNCGDLCVKSDDEEGIYFTKDGSVFSCSTFDDYMEENIAAHKFYPGDKITITF